MTALPLIHQMSNYIQTLTRDNDGNSKDEFINLLKVSKTCLFISYSPYTRFKLSNLQKLSF